MALDHHRKTVADQYPFDPGGVDELGGRIVIGRQHRDFSARRFQRGELRDGDRLGI